MRKWGILLTLLIWLLSSSSGGATSLKELLTNLEQDLKNGAPPSQIEKDLKEIKNAKEKYPVYYLPELNYLLEKEVEPVPPTKITFIKKLLFFVEPVKRAFEVLIFFLLFYTFIFYFQHVDSEPDKRRLFTLIVVLFLSGVVILNFLPGFYFLCGLGVVLATILKKRKTATFLLVAGLFSLITTVSVKNFMDYYQSPQFLYTIKTNRDGYAPEFLIEKAISNPLYREIEKVTNDLALGELKSLTKFKEITTNDPYAIGIIYNDIGYVNYLLGDYQKALKAFKKASSYLDSPVILFNLYITYSSLLKIEEANKIRDELLKEKIDISKASPIPLLIHVNSEEFSPHFPFELVVSFLLGIGFGFIVDRILGFYVDQVNSNVLQIPGMMSFVNSRLKFFIIIFLTALVVNYILGKAICNI
jgi:membrane associated rhomboid family serine protease